MIKNVLITGGAGGVGRYVAEELRGKYGVTLFDRTLPSQVRHPWEPDFPFVLGDLTSLADCMRAISIAQADAIVHMGAIPFNTERQPFETGPFRGIQRMPEDETMRVNTMGTYYLLDAARRLGVKKVAAASTFYVLGLGFRISKKSFKVEYLPIDEEHPLCPEDTYSLSKVLNEETMAAFSRAYDIQCVAFRLMGVNYPHAQTHQFGVTPEAKPGHVGGPIGTTYQYVDARDVAQACRLALESEKLGGFEAFYLSTDTTLAEETRPVVERLYPDLKAMAANLKGHEGMISIKKAQELLGYQPKWSWRNQPSEEHK
jgi:nucleoside-diphosphate-sugar epimerase